MTEPTTPLKGEEALRVLVMETLSSTIVAFNHNLDALALLARTLEDPAVSQTITSIKKGIVEVMRDVREEAVQERAQAASVPKKFERPEPTPRPTITNPEASRIDQALLSAKEALAQLDRASQTSVSSEPVQEEVVSTAQLIDNHLDRLFSAQLRINGKGKYFLGLQNEPERFALPVIQGSLQYMRLAGLIQSHHAEGVVIIDKDIFNVVFGISETSFLVIEDLQGQPSVSVRNDKDQVIFDTDSNLDSILQHLSALEKNTH